MRGIPNKRGLKYDINIHQERIQSKQRNGFFMTIDQEMRIKELEKQVEELSFIRGISDKFGTYISLTKDADIIMYFLADPNHTRRYIELIDEFTVKGWSKSTVEKHLRGLTDHGILKRGRLPGEYVIDYDLSNDMDTLVHYLIGDSLYNLARKSWEKKDYEY